MRKPLSGPRCPRRVVAGLFVALLDTGCARPDTHEPAMSAEPAPFIGPDTRVHPTGELGRTPDYTMSVEGVTECRLEGPFAPKRDHTKVGIELALEGASQREVPVNSFYALLEDGSGNTYASTLAGCEPGLAAVRLTNGMKARGFVTFEIPSGIRKLVLHYAPVVIGPGKEELKFAIER